MRWYTRWSSSIPELKGLPEFQRRQLWMVSYKDAHSKPRVWVSYVLMLITGYIAIEMFLIADVPKIIEPIGAPLIGAFIALTQQQYVIRVMRPFMATHRAAMEQQSRTDGSYYVPPAI
jgi:hypothetical protein